MKKRISLFLSALLALSVLTVGMTSCDEDKDRDDDDDDQLEEVFQDKTPEEAYNDALKAIESVDNYEMTSVQDIKMVLKYNGEVINQDQKQTITQQKNGEDVYVNVFGSSIKQETWYVDGVLYTISGDVKAKATLSLKEFQEQMMGTSSNNLLNIPEEWFEDVEFETEDGKTVLKFKIDGNEFLEMVDNALGAIGAAAEDMDISVVDYIVYFDDDGDITKIVQDFSLSFSLQGMKAEADYHTVTTVSLGTADKITAPKDGDSFIDVTDQMGSLG